MARSDSSTAVHDVLSPQLSTRRQAPTPSLSFDQFSSARSSSPSNVDIESPFLTPPVLDPRDLSPPPRPDEDDYLTAKGRRGYKRKHKVGHSRKHYNTREESGHSMPGGDTSTSAPHNLSLRASPSELYEEGSNDDRSESIPDAPAVSDASMKTSRHQSRNHQNATDFANVEIQRALFSISHTVVISHSQSPAVSALRRLSQPVGSDADIEFQRTLRMPEAITAPHKVPKPQATKSANDANRSSHENFHQRSSHCNSLSLQNTDRYGLTPTGPNTPAEITLRKASDAILPNPLPSPRQLRRPQTVGATLDQSPQTSASTAELVAFYSEQKYEAKQLQSFGLGSPVDIGPIRDTHDNATPNKLIRKETDPTGRLIKNPDFRRQSAVAEPTITFADVHVARGTFAVDPKSRKTSVVAPNSPRRMSVVQFRSRNSVHEIIWREDETTDGSSPTSSSQGSISPQRQQQMREAGDPNSENEGGRIQRSEATALRDKRSSLVAASLPTSLKQSHANIFQWSWGKPSSGSNLTSQRLADDLDISKRTGPNMPETPSVQSFPPLQERRSTSEWHKPLVDLDDPVPDRVPENRDLTPVKGADDSAGQCAGLQPDPLGWPNPRKQSCHPIAPARVRESDMAGSSLGSSSHQRIR